MTFLLLFFGLLALVFIDVPIGIALGVVATVAMGRDQWNRFVAKRRPCAF